MVWGHKKNDGVPKGPPVAGLLLSGREPALNYSEPNAGCWMRSFTDSGKSMYQAWGLAWFESRKKLAKVP